MTLSSEDMSLLVTALYKYAQLKEKEHLRTIDWVTKKQPCVATAEARNLAERLKEVIV